MTLELDNRSVTYPSGIAEDVIVKVDKFNFLADFVIVDFEDDHRVPIILRRPFLCTAKALIDLYEEKLTLRIGNEELAFRSEIFSKNSPSREHQSVHSINIIDSPYYEALYFDVDHIKEKSSGSTTSHSDLSLLEYVSFHFDFSIDPPPIAKRSDSHHEDFTDGLAHIISSPEYDHFYFDLEANPRELTRVLKKDISETLTKDLIIHDLNDFPLLLSDCDFIFSKEFPKINLLVLFPSRNKDKIFDPGIFIIKGVQSQIYYILPLDDFSTTSFVSDSLLLTDPSEIKTFLSFPSGNEDKVFDPGILIIDGVFTFTRKSPILLIDNFMIDKYHILSEISLMIESSVSFLPMDKEI
ncbi:putative reverse transcriptase domain-containing protein [Tanacetum coccineum]|uniref:Reverse transcriptase domain-containing protein n=1 Tax=Tanacetum coccineum TaxID=301880 RepID=A0ABQ4Y9P1_9ASTR